MNASLRGVPSRALCLIIVRVGRKPNPQRLTLDHVDLDRFDADADFSEPFDGGFDVGALTVEFQAHDANLIGHAALAELEQLEVT